MLIKGEFLMFKGSYSYLYQNKILHYDFVPVITTTEKETAKEIEVLLIVEGIAVETSDIQQYLY